MPSEAFWRLSEASVRGKGHIDHDMPNQDAVAIRSSGSGDVVVAVVSDGAGTAVRAEVGSRTTADFMADWLLGIGQDLSVARLTAEMISEKLAAGIELLRAELDKHGAPLRDFHCTLAGCVLTPRDGFVCQLGDSIAVASRFAEVDEPPPRRIDFFPDKRTQIFEVERGEYSNETHFVTEPDWRDHLRVAFLPPAADAVLLMSDGAMDIAVQRRAIFRGFLSSLLAKLLALPQRGERNAAVQDWLADPKSYPVTSDDKTLFVALRQSYRLPAGRAVFLEDAPQESLAPVSPAPGPVQAEGPIPPAPRAPYPADKGRTPAEAPRGLWAAIGILAAGALMYLVAFTELLIPGDSGPARPEARPQVEAKAKAASKAAAGVQQPPPALPEQQREGGADAKLERAALPAPAEAPKPPAPAEQAAPVAVAKKSEQSSLLTRAGERERIVVTLEGKLLRQHPTIESRKDLVLAPGASTRVTLRLKRGNHAKLLVQDLRDFDGQDGQGIRIVEEKGGSCVPDGVLSRKGGALSCSIRIQAAKGGSAKTRYLSITVKDDQEMEWGTLEIVINVVRPSAKRSAAAGRS